MIFIRINKTGSTSVATFVKGFCDTFQINKFNQRVDRAGGWLDRERIKNQECFTVVRNPFKRAISCYNHCIRLGNIYTFVQWLEKDFTEMSPKERVHSIRQVDFLRDSRDSIEWVNYILKLEDENLESKIKSLTGAVGELPHDGKGCYSEDEKIYYSDSYAKELVKSKYYLDFKTFGYEIKEFDI